jgi:multiple sugar transport system ATP-binding protein
MDRKPSEMSGGQQQRMAIARALVKMPKVLLLDEPLSNLAARLRLQTREELKRIQQETGITTIFVTHDQEEAMSISDLIVVMKDGVLQQMDLPQRVYDDPVNLFVAKFLGTPPINVFDGYFMNGKLCIGDTPVLDADCDYDGHVEVAVRPEGFVPCEDGPLECSLKRVEVMGRDISVVCDHPEFTGESFRAIVDGDDLPKLTGTTVRFALKPNKVFAFREDSGERIQF